MHTSGIRNAKALVVMGAVSLALVAAGPASANDSQPTSGGKRCVLKLPNGASDIYEHGDTVTISGSDGTTTKWKCDDGTWGQVKTAESSPTRTFGGTSGTSGTYDGGTSGTTGTNSGTSGTTGTYYEPTP